MKKSWVNVALFESLKASQTLEDFFKSNGVKARRYDDKLLQLFLFLCRPQMTFRVQVHSEDFVRATELMDAKSPDVLKQAIHCPDCGSLRINYPQMTRKFLIPTIGLHLCILFRIVDHQAFCESCHWMWPLPKPGVRPTPKPESKPFPF